tara:strand:- start:587 stop:4210 length:3624 start_codon:yes stop_codon:yes gene_type:complete
LYDYYDVTEKLSNSPLFSEIKSFIGKYVILYYKTQTTDRLNLSKNTDNKEDYDLPIIYKGIISRVSQSSDSISIQAEDFTQQYISDKQIPKTKIEDLEDSIKNNVFDKELDEAVPLVIGKVDKAPVVKYKTNFQSQTGLGSLGFIHDSRAIYNNFPTSNVDDFSYWYLYFKDDDDYTIFEYPTSFNYYEGKTFFVDTQSYAESGLAIAPEMQEEQVSSIFLKGHTFPIKVLADLSGENELSNIQGYIDEDMLVPNYNDVMTKNPKVWKRTGEANSGFQGSEFTGTITYDSDNQAGKGRWMIVKFDKNKKIFYIKTTIFSMDSLYNMNINNNTSDAYLYAKPFNADQWKEFIQTPFSWHLNNRNALLNDDNINDKEFAKVGYASSRFEVGVAPILQGTENLYFKESSSEGYTGYSYGPTIKKSYDETKETDKTILFELYNSIQDGTYTVGHWIGAMAAGYYKEINQFEGEDVFASVGGRQDYTSTEPIDELPSLFEGVETSLSFALYGSDNISPNFDDIISTLDTYLLEYTEQFLYKPFLLKSVDAFGYRPLQSMPQLFGENAVGFPIKSLNVLNTIILGLYSKMYMNILDKEIQNLGNLGLDIVGAGTAGDAILEAFIQNLQKFYQQNYQMNFTWNANLDEDGWEGWHSFVLSDAETGSITIGTASIVWIAPDNLLENTTSQYESHRRLLLQRILQYMYQSNIDTGNVANTTGFTQNWDDYNIDLESSTAISEYVDNMTVYFDDTINTINKDILNVESTTENAGPNGDCDRRFELYVWNDTPYYYGQTNPFYIQLYQYINPSSFVFEIESQGTTGSQFNTTGFIEKPIDIFINLLSRELDFGIDGNILDNGKFDAESINKARDFYSDWKMGFALDDFKEAKKLLEDISKETQSFVHFNEQGKFSVINIANNYYWDNIDKIINADDIISYKFDKTKIENVTTKLKCYYRYDNGNDTYLENIEVEVDNSQDFYDYYNTDEQAGYKELQLRYHTDSQTATKFAQYYLSQHCNQHLLIDIELPLGYILDVGNIVYLPLINNTKAFGIDYSQVEMLNGQYLYPAFMVMTRDLSMNKAKYRLMQLHHDIFNYMDIDFVVPESEPFEIFGNFKEFNSIDGRLHNWNYNPNEGVNPNYTYTQIEEEIPYGDINGDGVVDIADVVMLVEHIIGNIELTNTQKERIQNYRLSSFTKTDFPDSIGVSKVVAMVEYLLG